MRVSLIIPFFIFSIVQCHPVKSLTFETQNIYITHAISDFRRIKKVFTRDSIFEVSFKSSADRNIVIVSIFKNQGNYLFNPSDTVGSSKLIPNRAIELDGRLFLWNDSAVVGDRDILSVLDRHNLLKIYDGNAHTLPDISVDDGAYAVTYFFCKTSPSRFERVVSNRRKITSLNLRCQ